MQNSRLGLCLFIQGLIWRVLKYLVIGAFGNVRVCWLKTQANHKYAIKCMKKAEIIKSKHVDHIENEKKILERIEHPFIVTPRRLIRLII